MEPNDPELIEFLKTVFHDMKMRHAETNALNLSSPDRARARPYARFKTQLYVMFRALDPMHKAGLETLFTFLPLNYSNAFSLMSAHLSAIWEEFTDIRDIFLYMMYTCSFTYSLLAFCESEGQYGFLYLFPRWIVKVYSDLIEQKFRDANGWSGLLKFCSSCNLHFILDFINLCYNKQGKLFTYITLGNSYFFYGLHNDDTLILLKNKFPDFKNSVFAEFKHELDSNMVYKAVVMLAFIKIELAFDLTASVFNPPSPTRRLLYPSIVLFKNLACGSLRHENPARVLKILIKQGRIRAKQERDRIRRERVRAEQERARAILERVRFNQEQESAMQGQAHLPVPEETSINIEQAPADLEETISIIQQSIADIAFGSFIEKHAPRVTDIPDYKKLSLGVLEQAPAIVEQDPACVEQYPSDIVEHAVNPEQALVPVADEHFSLSVEQVSDNVEGAGAAIQVLEADRHSLGAAERVSNIRTGKPLFRVILVKEPPGDHEIVSDSEVETCPSCGCQKTDN